MRNLFPTGGHIEQAMFWTGLRPVTPDGTPLVGATALNNLYLTEYRSRYAEQDNGMWLGAIAGGYYQRAGAGNLL